MCNSATPNVSTQSGFDGDAQPTIYIVDDDQVVRSSLLSLLDAMKMQAIAFESGEAFLQTYDGAPGCLITDVRMPSGLGGLELQKQLPKISVPLPVILITAYAETSLTVLAMQNGAITLLEKPYRDHELLDAIQAALRVDRKRRQRESECRKILQRLDTLTPEEHLVLELILDGVTNKVISKRLDISVRTVENRRKNIYSKMETQSIAPLVKMVTRAKLMSGEDDPSEQGLL